MSEFGEEVRAYEPRDGVDYLVDLYGVTGVPHDAFMDDIRGALRDRSLEYHPDRLAGLAPEFRARGERMALLINRARVVLLDDEKRDEYDGILASWEGPISTDGTPILDLNAAVRTVMARHDPEEIETAFTAQYEQAAAAHKANPKRRVMHERMLAVAEAEGGEDVEELREALDEDLLAEEGALSLSAEERGRLLGLAGESLREPALGHAAQVRLAIEGARTVVAEEHQRRVLGGVSTRLALLAGDSASEGVAAGTSAEIVASAGPLPRYFDDQAEQVAKIAERREEILTKRLEIFEPTYPMAEMQSEAQSGFVLGVINPDAQDHTTWLAFTFDPDTLELTNFNTPDDLAELLTHDDFEQVYTNGYNIVTLRLKDHIEIRTLVTEASKKYLYKFYPDLQDQLAKAYGW